MPSPERTGETLENYWEHKDIKKFWIDSAEIHRRFYSREKAKPSESISLCRSLRQLYERGYLEPGMITAYARRGKGIILSAAGLKKAKSIIESPEGKAYTGRKKLEA